MDIKATVTATLNSLATQCRAGDTTAYGLPLRRPPCIIFGLEIAIRTAGLAMQGPAVLIDSANAAVQTAVPAVGIAETQRPTFSAARPPYLTASQFCAPALGRPPPIIDRRPRLGVAMPRPIGETL